MELDEFMNELYKAIDKKGMTILTGAGLSTASGIKDFRGKNGLYKQNVKAETILSRDYFEVYPEDFYHFFRKELIVDNVKPNLMHEVIKMLQDKGVVRCVITQNIDNLDREAGTKDVLEIHGNATRFSCMDCKKPYSLEDIKGMDLVPRCSCGGIIRPDIVLYEEIPNPNVMNPAMYNAQFSNSFLVIGSSLAVTTAYSIVHAFAVEKQYDDNKQLFIINQGPTQADGLANYKYDGDIIDVAEKIKKYIMK